MAEVDNILGTIIFVIVSLTIFSLLIIGFTNYKENEYTQEIEIFTYQQNQYKLETILSSDDIYSNEPIINTIYQSFKYDGYYNSTYGTINISNSLKLYFDYYYGKNKYYIHFQPNISTLKINILYDDGGFMKKIKDEYNLEENIMQLYENFQENSNINFDFEIHILSNETRYDTDKGSCKKYEDQLEITCNLISVHDLYIENDQYFKDPIKHSYPEQYISPQQKTTYFYNDWATFVGKISKNNQDRNIVADLNLILLFTDVMSLGGPSDEYFTGNYTINLLESCGVNNIVSCNSDSLFPTTQQKQICVNCVLNTYYNTYAKKSIDYYCKKNTNFSTSDYTVERLKTLLEENNDIVFPIIVRNNNNSESESIRETIEKSAYSSYLDSPETNNGDPNTLCGKENCLGCFENSTHAIFHNETRNNHISQTQSIADTSGGEVIFFKENPNIYNIINETITDTINKYSLELGTKKTDSKKEYYFVKNNIISIDKSPIEMITKFTLYDDIAYNFSNNLEFIPIINEYKNSEDEFQLILSHNKEISNLKINNSLANKNLIENIGENYYKYNFSVPSFSATQNSIINLNYTDSNGIHNKNFTLN
jgi:hypothetical protein